MVNNAKRTGSKKNFETKSLHEHEPPEVTREFSPVRSKNKIKLRRMKSNKKVSTEAKKPESVINIEGQKSSKEITATSLSKKKSPVDSKNKTSMATKKESVVRLYDAKQTKNNIKTTTSFIHHINVVALTPSQEKKILEDEEAATIFFWFCKYDILRIVAEKLHMKIGGQEWDIFWTDQWITFDKCKVLKPHQRVNHFPGMTELCRKDLLTRNLTRMRRKFPKDYNFYPRSWLLPQQTEEVSRYFEKKKKRVTFILKPERGCQGKGIYLAKNVSEIDSTGRVICQLYIEKPFLIDGFKFDLRVYCLITSIEPLSVFIYNEGLVRFATVTYEPPDNDNMKEVYMHLTNAALNKSSSKYIFEGSQASKRKISTMNTWFQQHGYDVEMIWEGIDDSIIKTIISGLPMLQTSFKSCFGEKRDKSCFQILGFDVLLDEKLKSYVLEVNHTPSFQTDTPTDFDVKGSLIADTFILLKLHKKLNLNDCRTDDVSVSSFDSCCSSEVSLNLINSEANWKKEHKGNFRRIFPCKDVEKYQKFLDGSRRSWEFELVPSTDDTNTPDVQADTQSLSIGSKTSVIFEKVANVEDRVRSTPNGWNFVGSGTIMAERKFKSEIKLVCNMETPLVEVDKIKRCVSKPSIRRMYTHGVMNPFTGYSGEICNPHLNEQAGVANAQTVEKKTVMSVKSPASSGWNPNLELYHIHYEFVQEEKTGKQDENEPLYNIDDNIVFSEAGKKFVFEGETFSNVGLSEENQCLENASNEYLSGLSQNNSPNNTYSKLKEVKESGNNFCCNRPYVDSEPNFTNVGSLQCDLSCGNFEDCSSGDNPPVNQVSQEHFKDCDALNSVSAEGHKLDYWVISQGSLHHFEDCSSVILNNNSESFNIIEEPSLSTLTIEEKINTLITVMAIMDTGSTGTRDEENEVSDCEKTIISQSEAIAFDPIKESSETRSNSKKGATEKQTTMLSLEVMSFISVPDRPREKVEQTPSRCKTPDGTKHGGIDKDCNKVMKRRCPIFYDALEEVVLKKKKPSNDQFYEALSTICTDSFTGANMVEKSNLKPEYPNKMLTYEVNDNDLVKGKQFTAKGKEESLINHAVLTHKLKPGKENFDKEKKLGKLNKDHTEKKKKLDNPKHKVKEEMNGFDTTGRHVSPKECKFEVKKMNDSPNSEVNDENKLLKKQMINMIELQMENRRSLNTLIEEKSSGCEKLYTSSTSTPTVSLCFASAENISFTKTGDSKGSASILFQTTKVSSSSTVAIDPIDIGQVVTRPTQQGKRKDLKQKSMTSLNKTTVNEIIITRQTRKTLSAPNLISIPKGKLTTKAGDKLKYYDCKSSINVGNKGRTKTSKKSDTNCKKTNNKRNKITNTNKTNTNNTNTNNIITNDTTKPDQTKMTDMQNVMEDKYYQTLIKILLEEIRKEQKNEEERYQRAIKKNLTKHTRKNISPKISNYSNRSSSSYKREKNETFKKIENKEKDAEGVPSKKSEHTVGKIRGFNKENVLTKTGPSRIHEPQHSEREIVATKTIQRTRCKLHSNLVPSKKSISKTNEIQRNYQEKKNVVVHKVGQLSEPCKKEIEEKNPKKLKVRESITDENRPSKKKTWILRTDEESSSLKVSDLRQLLELEEKPSCFSDTSNKVKVTDSKLKNKMDRKLDENVVTYSLSDNLKPMSGKEKKKATVTKKQNLKNAAFSNDHLISKQNCNQSTKATRKVKLTKSEKIVSAKDPITIDSRVILKESHKDHFVDEDNLTNTYETNELKHKIKKCLSNLEENSILENHYISRIELRYDEGGDNSLELEDGLTSCKQLKPRLKSKVKNNTQETKINSVEDKCAAEPCPVSRSAPDASKRNLVVGKKLKKPGFESRKRKGVSDRVCYTIEEGDDEINGTRSKEMSTTELSDYEHTKPIRTLSSFFGYIMQKFQ